MEIQLINSEKFYITQQDEILFKGRLGIYNNVEIKSINCPEFDDEELDTLFLRGDLRYRDLDNIRVPQEKMKQVLTALSMCCIKYGVTLTIKL